MTARFLFLRLLFVSPLLISCIVSADDAFLLEGCSQPQDSMACAIEHPAPVIKKRRRRHSRQRQPDDASTARAKKRASLSTMTFNELDQARELQKTGGNTSSVIKYTERMLKLCDDVNRMGTLLLELADLLFQEGRFNKSELIYARFNTLYPGSEQAEYASYKQILCSFYSMYPADRDQTKTEETAELARQFLNREMFTGYKKEVSGILTQCYDRLFESESRICTFYAQHHKKSATQKRLSCLRDLLAKAPELEPRLIAFESDIALMMGNTVLAEQKRTELSERFPEVHNQLVTTHNSSKQRSFAHRF